jgi:hypothetical protein
VPEEFQDVAEMGAAVEKMAMAKKLRVRVRRPLGVRSTSGSG